MAGPSGKEKSSVKIVVTGIRQERIRILLELSVTFDGSNESVRKADALQFYIADMAKRRCKGDFESVKVEGNRVYLTYLVTNCGDNSCLSAGQYEIAVLDEKDEYLCSVSSPREGISRQSFTYPFQKKKWYRAAFEAGADEALKLIITRYDGKKSVRRCISDVKKAVFQCICNILRLKYAAKRKQTILFLDKYGDNPGDNIEAVKRRMKERSLDKKWRMLSISEVPAGGKRSIKSDLKVIDHLAKSGVVVTDEHIAILDWLDAGKDQRLIQVWHAGVGFKATGYSRWGHSGGVSPESSHRKITYATVTSEKVRGIFSELWGIADEQVIPCGMPRMDEFLNSEKNESIKERLMDKYPACRDKRVILFAPTYRGRGKKDASYPFDKIDFEGLKDTAKAGGWTVLVKMHPWVREKDFVPVSCKDVIMEADERLEELFCITDLLITDYSSALFEFSLLKKPMLFYAFDEESYAQSRGFHRSYRENAPGKVVTEFEQLLSAIRDEDFESEKLDEYVNRHFDNVDTHSSDRVIDYLIEDQLPEKYGKALSEHRKRVKHRKEIRL